MYKRTVYDDVMDVALGRACSNEHLESRVRKLESFVGRLLKKVDAEWYSEQLERDYKSSLSADQLAMHKELYGEKDNG